MSVSLPIVNQGATARYEATLVDETGEAIQTSDLLTLTLTLYAKKTGAIINSRSAVSVLNANGGTFADGAFVMTFTPADMAHLGIAPVEEHVALFAWTYAVSKAGSHEVLLRVRDVGRI